MNSIGGASLQYEIACSSLRNSTKLETLNLSSNYYKKYQFARVSYTGLNK